MNNILSSPKKSEHSDIFNFESFREKKDSPMKIEKQKSRVPILIEKSQSIMITEAMKMQMHKEVSHSADESGKGNQSGNMTQGDFIDFFNQVQQESASCSN